MFNKTTFANVTIVSAAVFFGLLLILSIYRGSPVGYATEFRIFLAAAISLLTVSLKLSPSHRVHLAVILVSTGLTVLVAEASLERLLRETDYDQEAAKRADFVIDTRSTLQVIQDLRESGLEEVYPGYIYSLGTGYSVSGGEKFFPLGGVSNATHIGSNESGEYVIYQSDEHGFNNPLGIWESDRIQVVSIGDSFTHGATVDTGKNYTALIRAVYKNTLNLGEPGTGPLAHLATVKEYLGDLEPQVVLWFYFEGNDLCNMIDEFESDSHFKLYLDGDYRQDLTSKQQEIDLILKSIANTELAFNRATSLRDRWIFRMLTLRDIRGQIARIFGESPPCGGATIYQAAKELCEPEKVLARFESVLRDAGNYVDSWGGKLYFVYLPSWDRYSGGGSDTCARVGREVDYHERVLSMVSDLGLPAIDISEAFNSHSDPLSLFPFRLNAHYNEEGQRLVAATVLQSINVEHR